MAQPGNSSHRGQLHLQQGINRMWEAPATLHRLYTQATENEERQRTSVFLEALS